VLLRHEHEHLGIELGLGIPSEEIWGDLGRSGEIWRDMGRHLRHPERGDDPPYLGREIVREAGALVDLARYSSV
jgi:hypothetical protein